MDVGKVRCDHIHSRLYHTTHPDAPGLVGEGATPEESCSDLADKAGRPFKAYHRGPSVLVDGSPRDGAILHEGEGYTPEQAWKAANASKAKQLRDDADKL